MEKTPKSRSEFRIGKRIVCNTRKQAFEKAKRASEPGEKPELHGGLRPHYHPTINNNTLKTPKAISFHDHYYFPKRNY